MFKGRLNGLLSYLNFFHIIRDTVFAGNYEEGNEEICGFPVNNNFLISIYVSKEGSKSFIILKSWLRVLL